MKALSKVPRYKHGGRARTHAAISARMNTSIECPLMRRLFFIGAFMATLLYGATGLAHDHSGPPMPLLRHEHVGLWSISVWAHEHAGARTFFVRVDPASGHSVPDDLKVGIGVQPVSRQQADKFYSLHRDPAASTSLYVAEIPINIEETWRVKVRLESSQGSGETVTTIDTSASSTSPWLVMLYLLPFISVAALWLRSLARSRNVQLKRWTTIDSMQINGR